MTKTIIALGGNLGDVPQTINVAIQKLQQCAMSDIVCSALLVSKPVDCPENTPDFINGALMGQWAGSALELLRCCQQIEVECGRPAEHGHNNSRTLDLDIILFGDNIIDLPELKVPHPRACERMFVMEPVSQLAPDWIFPDLQMSARDIWKELCKR